MSLGTIQLFCSRGNISTSRCTYKKKTCLGGDGCPLARSALAAMTELLLMAEENQVWYRYLWTRNKDCWMM